MLDWIRRTGYRALDRVASLGRASMLWVASLLWLPAPADLYLVVRQIYSVGVLSLIIIMLSAFSIGAVLALQFYTQLSRFGAQDAVGVGLAVVLLRELGPVITALLFAGRAGSAITAEIGLMKSTEQLTSMEMMGVDPLRRVVAPRLWAGFICLPLLTAIFNVVAIYGGVVVGIEWLGIESGAFWSGMNDTVEIWEDIGKGMLKSVFFAVVVTWIAVFQGYDTYPSAEGIGLATTRTVVYSSVVILALDFLLDAQHVWEFLNGSGQFAARRAPRTGEAIVMRMRTVEISVGAFVLAGILALIFLVVRVSGINFEDSSTYTISARFDDVAGLKRRAKVSMAGVVIGRVSDIRVDTEYGEAVVYMEIEDRAGGLSLDTGAQILTEGIIGSRYVSLLPGAAEETLGEGDEILDTQGALVLENLIGDLVTNLGS